MNPARTRVIAPLAVAVTVIVTGCVTTGTHEAAIAAEQEKQAKLQSTLDAANDQLAKTRKDLAETTKAREAMQTQGEQLDAKLASALQQNQTLVDKVNSMGENVEQLLGEKDNLAAEREAMTQELAELRRMQKAAEARAVEYKELISKLAKMIDAGSLEVKVRNGLMLVAMSSDVLFSPGSARLKPAAQEAIEELAVTIASFSDRKFQVVGHSDSTPIHSARFPSNWELSSQRAIEVVRVLVDAGVPPEMISAAGAAEFDPLVPNDSPENKALNRRVELIFVPKIDELPGFDQILGAKN